MLKSKDLDKWVATLQATSHTTKLIQIHHSTLELLHATIPRVYPGSAKIFEDGPTIYLKTSKDFWGHSEYFYILLKISWSQSRDVFC